MGWNETITTITRVLENDLVVPYTHSNAKITQTIVVAAYYVQQEISFDTLYTIDVVGLTITPDPVDLQDQAFINFVSLKTACLLDHGTYRLKVAMDGLEARCGMAQLKVSGHSAGFKALLALGPCATYDELKKQYQFGDASIIYGIFSPFISDTFNPGELSSGKGDYR